MLPDSPSELAGFKKYQVEAGKKPGENGYVRRKVYEDCKEGSSDPDRMVEVKKQKEVGHRTGTPLDPHRRPP